MTFSHVWAVVFQPTLHVAYILRSTQTTKRSTRAYVPAAEGLAFDGAPPALPQTVGSVAQDTITRTKATQERTVSKEHRSTNPAITSQQRQNTHTTEAQIGVLVVVIAAIQRLLY